MQYDWAALGKTAETAVWQQLVLSEGVDTKQDNPTTEAVATVLLDMVKCFEKVKLMHVWRWGRYWGVPVGLLKLILQVFTFQRTMIVEGSHSNRIRTVNAIVPGSAFSCAILHIVLLWPCDNLLRLLPTIRLAKYVDDLSITVKGPRDKAADTVVAATKRLLDMLESDLDMEVSKTDASKQGKSVVLCTHQGMKQRMQRVMKQMGIRFAARERHLGVDCYGRGRRSGASTKTRRMSAMKTRTKRLQMLKRHGAKVHKVALAGIKPSVLYGCKAMGLSESHIRALRS